VQAIPPGLTNAEAHRRLTELGANAVAEEVAPRWRTYLEKFWSPMPWMLEAAILLQIGLGEFLEAGLIGGLLLFNATLSFVQEGRANGALVALKKRLAPAALVRRDGAWVKCPAADLVPGDVISLSLGAVVPADACLVSGSVLVDASMLTGEAIPVEMSPGSLACASSLVRRGQAIAEVTATGPRTYFGRAAELVRIAHSTSTEQAAIFGVTRALLAVNGAVALLILVIAYVLAMPEADVVRLALTALLASIPVALPATFTLSAAVSAQILAARGVLLTRLSASHEAAAMDVLCSDKTGTLTRNALQIAEIRAMPGFESNRVLALAALASSEADEDPIDSAICSSASRSATLPDVPQLVRFVPFDPVTKTAEAFALDREGTELRIMKGAYQAVANAAQMPVEARGLVDELARDGNRVIAVAIGPPGALHLAGLIVISDPPREDSAQLIRTLQELGVRTVMVTGDSPVTAAAIAARVGIAGAVCPPERISEELSLSEFGVFARVVPEEKYRLVKALQAHGHVVGMCGDGANDAPALRQAQIGIAVSSATDVAKAAAGMVLTEPGLGGIVFAVREGRIAFRRLLSYTLNMLVKKTEIVLFIAIGLILTGRAVMTPALMILMILTNDFLAMSLTTDRARAAPAPCRWQMHSIASAAIMLALCKLAFSTALLAFGKFQLGLAPDMLRTLAFVTLVFGNQAVMYVVREPDRLWRSAPSKWVLISSATDLALVSTLALSGTLMAPLPWRLVAAILLAAAGFTILLDQVKLRVMSPA
jgi:H+-transporting ATPase